MNLRTRLDNSGNCARIFGEAGVEGFWELAKNIKYYDGRPDSPGSERAQNDVSGNGVSDSLAATVQSAIAAVLTTNNGAPTDNVVLGSDFFGDSTVSTPDTLLHEALHVVLGMNDSALTYYLSTGFGYRPTGYDSHSISDWLKDNCPDKSGGK